MKDSIVICSYHFARSKASDVATTPWDLVVIDEAHRLRNVYKPSNVIANTLKLALQERHKLLLTATPLQNSLLELFGLASIIDEHAFGDLKSFREQFANLTQEQVFQTLKARLKPFCYRTLRRQVHDPATGKSAGEILEIDDATGRLLLLRGPKLSKLPLPQALHLRWPLRRSRATKRGPQGLPNQFSGTTDASRALKAILNREQPRIRGVSAGGRLQTTDLGEMKALALGLDASYLFVQGPPGTGKTWTGARLIVHLIANGKRVGVAAQSHKAIHKLLDEIEKVAHEDGVRFQGLKKSTGENPESEYQGDFIKNEPDASTFIQTSRTGPACCRDGLAFLAE